MSFPKGQLNPAKRKEIREILSKQKIGKNNPKWKGGRIQVYSHSSNNKNNPYIKVKIYNHPYSDSNNYIMEHILVMEKHLGRYLTKNEIVHHKNGIKTDNRIENLEITNLSIHAKHHIRINLPLEKIKEQYINNMPIYKICKKYSVSYDTIKRRLKELNIWDKTKNYKISNINKWKDLKGL